MALLPSNRADTFSLVETFGKYAWIPVHSELLDYENAQILLVGHGEDTSHGENIQPAEGDDDIDDIDELAHENAQRVHKIGKHLQFQAQLTIQGKDAILKDLRVSSKDYPSLASTW
jgi:hypothetical protein